MPSGGWGRHGKVTGAHHCSCHTYRSTLGHLSQSCHMHMGPCRLEHQQQLHHIQLHTCKLDRLQRQQMQISTHPTIAALTPAPMQVCILGAARGHTKPMHMQPGGPMHARPVYYAAGVATAMRDDPFRTPSIGHKSAKPVFEATAQEPNNNKQLAKQMWYGAQVRPGTKASHASIAQTLWLTCGQCKGCQLRHFVLPACTPKPPGLPYMGLPTPHAAKPQQVCKLFAHMLRTHGKKRCQGRRSLRSGARSLVPRRAWPS